MLAAVFVGPTYQHMVNSNNKLKFYTAQTELIQPPSMQLTIPKHDGKSAILNGITSKASRQRLCGTASPQPIRNWSSAILDEFYARCRPQHGQQDMLNNRTRSTCPKNKIAAAAELEEDDDQQKQRTAEDGSPMRFLRNIYTLLHNNHTDVLDQMAAGDAPFDMHNNNNNNNIITNNNNNNMDLAETNDNLQFPYDLMRKLQNICLLDCLRSLFESWQNLAIRPIQQRIISVYIEHFSLRLEHLMNVTLPRLRQILVDEPTAIFVEHFQTSYAQLVATTNHRSVLEPKAVILDVLQSCGRHPGHEEHCPSMADALPPMMIVPPSRIEMPFLMDSFFRHKVPCIK